MYHLMDSMILEILINMLKIFTYENSARRKIRMNPKNIKHLFVLNNTSSDKTDAMILINKLLGND